MMCCIIHPQKLFRDTFLMHNPWNWVEGQGNKRKCLNDSRVTNKYKKYFLHSSEAQIYEKESPVKFILMTMRLIYMFNWGQVIIHIE